MEIFKLPERAAYSMAAMGDGSSGEDKTYSAVMSVSAACRGLIHKLGESTHGRGHCYVFPYIVVGGPLWEACLLEDGTLDVREVDQGLLASRNPALASHTFITIVTEKRLESLVDGLRREAIELIQIAHRLGTPKK
jgi:hypothetical protein